VAADQGRRGHGILAGIVGVNSGNPKGQLSGSEAITLTFSGTYLSYSLNLSGVDNSEGFRVCGYNGNTQVGSCDEFELSGNNSARTVTGNFSSLAFNKIKISTKDSDDEIGFTGFTVTP
ncbi:MAG: hypothetical protein HQL39_16040, partial [Alphaproteobacteria bacterium]|nr:hypothetical protein [Alphaproteobacteria bacterium]